MNYTTGCLHPLRRARPEVTGVTHAVLMLHMPIHHISEGGEPAVRMRRKTRDVIIWVIAADVIQQQEGIVIAQRLCTDRAVCDHASTVRYRPCRDDSYSID